MGKSMKDLKTLSILAEVRTGTKQKLEASLLWLTCLVRQSACSHTWYTQVTS